MGSVSTVENLRLQGELRSLQHYVDAEELSALRADVDAMRIEVLRTSEQLHHLQSTPVVQSQLQCELSIVAIVIVIVSNCSICTVCLTWDWQKHLHSVYAVIYNVKIADNY